MDAQPFANNRILVVEDEVMIGFLLTDYLEELGYVVARQADNIEDALRLATEETDFDAALLDVNLHGKHILPVAAALKARNVPFCLMTGYGGVAEDRIDAPVLGKPFDAKALKSALESLIPVPG